MPSVTLPIFEAWRCEERIHCASCRGDREFRRSAGEFYELPDGLTDFACPFGVPWPNGFTPTDERQGDVPKPQPKPSLLARALHGAIETAKTAVGVGVASEATVAHRRATCEACPSGLYTPCVMGTRHCCGALLTGSGNDMNNPGCGCIISNKIKRANESCPKGHWGPEADGEAR